MKKYIYIAGIVLSSLMTACSLDIAPISDQSELNLSGGGKDTTRIKYKDRAAMQSVYENLYKVMKDRQEHWYVDYLLFGEARTDNAYAGTTGAEVVPVETNALDASNPDIARDWDRYLEDIAKANVVICNIDKVPDPAFSKEERARWKAEALIFRSMMIFDLAHWFGNIPLNLEEAPDITAENIESVYPIYFPAPVTQDKAYQQVITDLTAAEKDAPDMKSEDKSILSKTVARALLAKVYAEVGDWAMVEKYCLQVLSDGISLEEDYRNLFGFNTDMLIPTRSTLFGTASKEVILEVPYFTGSGNWCTWMFGRNLANYDESFTWAKWITPSEDLMNAFAAAGDTIRQNQTIVYYDCSWSNYYPSNHYPFMYKCRSSYNSIIKLRGGDIILLLAEAYAHNNKSDLAIQQLNDVRKRVHLTEYKKEDFADERNLLDAIFNERRLELALEGQRLFDLIRFGKLEEVMNTINQRDSRRLPQARPFVPAHRLMPIPQTAIDQNSNLKQNDGY